MQSGKLWALVGSSRSGKTAKTQKELEKFKAVMIWDIQAQYACDHRFTKLDALKQFLLAHPGYVGVIAYTGSTAHFNLYCKLAWLYLTDQCRAGRHCALVFEETADVTNPGKAPEYYGIILRRSLVFGVTIFAITQRPAESDKTAIGNASMMHVCRLNRANDRKSIAAETGLSLDLVSGLIADQDNKRFDWVTVNTGTQKFDIGQLTFPAEKPRFTTKSKNNSL